MNKQHIDPFDPFVNPTGENPGPEYWKWYTLYEQLKGAIYDSLPFDHPVRSMFWRCEPENDIHPNLESIKLALSMLGQLPTDDRSNALSGWNVPRHLLQPVPVPVGEAIKLCLHCSCDMRRPIIADLEPLALGTTHPVEVFIHVGTKKMQAITALRHAADQLERNWERLIEDAGTDAENDETLMQKHRLRPDAFDPPAETPADAFDAMIDEHYTKLTQMLKSLGVVVGEDAHGVCMPDGSHRKLFCVVSDGPWGSFIGPKIDVKESDA